MMTITKMMEGIVKDHLKAEENEYLGNYPGLKVINEKFVEMIECFGGCQMVKYEVVCSFKAKKYEDNRVKFQINLYESTDENEDQRIGCYFDGTFYQG